MRNYIVVGVEAFGVAEIKGMFDNREKAAELANMLESKKSNLCCQRYTAMSWTEANRKYELYS